MIIANLLMTARKLDNYQADATSGVLWVDTTHFRATCPSGKRWILIGGCFYRAVAATATVTLNRNGTGTLLLLASQASATGTFNFPENIETVYSAVNQLPLVLDAGDYIESIFSVAQNASSTGCCMVLEVDV